MSIARSIGHHFQNGAAYWAWSECNAAYHKLIDPPAAKPAIPGNLIGRIYIPDGDANALVMQGAAGADIYFARCKPMYDRAAYCYAFEGPNEPPVATPQQRAALVAFTRRWVALMHAAHYRTVALCLSVGWPDVGTAHELAPALDDTDFWALHEYSAPTMQDDVTWLCLRYRRTVAELRAAGSRIPPLLITECGIDGGVLGAAEARKGWKSYTTWDKYLAQLEWYICEVRQDDYVVGVMPFSATPNEDWIDFETTHQIAVGIREINARLSVVTPPVDPPVTPPEVGMGTPEVYDEFAKKQTWQWLQDKYGRVDHYPLTGRRYACARVQEQNGPANLLVRVLDMQGNPKANSLVIMTYPNLANPADFLPDLTKGDIAPKMWSVRGSAQFTDNNGYTAFGLGKDSWITDKSVGGPYYAWIFDKDMASDCIGRIGWLPFTNHLGPTSIVFQQTEGTPEYASLHEQLLAEGEIHQAIQLNPTAALQKKINAAGFQITSDEWESVRENVVYVCQRAERLSDGAVGVWYCVKGDWGNVKTEWRAVPPLQGVTDMVGKLPTNPDGSEYETSDPK